MKLIRGQFKRRGEELRKERAENLSLDVMGETKTHRWSEERDFTSRFDIDKITQRGCSDLWKRL